MIQTRLLLHFPLRKARLCNNFLKKSQLADQKLTIGWLYIQVRKNIGYKLYLRQTKIIMGGSVSGAINAQGYSQSLKSNHLPDYNHITHSGIFNENYFQVGDKAKSLIEIHHGLAISNCDLYDLPNRNYFLSLFVKSSTDGEKRTRPLNVVLCLDVSGSMDSGLKKVAFNQEGKPIAASSRTSLAKKAILMMYDKLDENDVFSLVTFQNKANTVIESTFVKDLNRQNVKKLVQQKFGSGGTTISAGFLQSLANIKTFKQANKIENYENRIVMLTDVGDNSIEGQQKLIQQISDCGVSTTIIGISTEFKSSTCERLIKVKGFNYMCAVQDQDLQTYLVDQFDYTFFPCVQNTVINIRSQAVKSIEVFGSVDHDIKYPVESNVFTVTRMNSGFPSALTFNKKGKLQTKGGLILVKFTPNQAEKLPKILLQIQVNYSDLNGKHFTQSYLIDKAVEVQEYFQDEATKKGVQLFYYTQTIRNLLFAMKQGANVLSDSNKGFYLGKLDKLREYCPHDKKEQLQKLYQVVAQK